jgi:hypothetical protein
MELILERGTIDATAFNRLRATKKAAHKAPLF